MKVGDKVGGFMKSGDPVCGVVQAINTTGQVLVAPIICGPVWAPADRLSVVNMPADDPPAAEPTPAAPTPETPAAQ